VWTEHCSCCHNKLHTTNQCCKVQYKGIAPILNQCFIWR